MRVFGDAVELVGFQPVSEKQFAREPHPDFVKGVLNQTIANGFGNRDAKVAQSLPYTSGLRRSPDTIGALCRSRALPSNPSSLCPAPATAMWSSAPR